MPKLQYTINSFAGGINTLKDPRDIAENEAGFIKNMSIDAQGKIKSAGSMIAHSESPVDGTTNLTNYVSQRGGSGASAAVLDGGGGYNLFYFDNFVLHIFVLNIYHMSILDFLNLIFFLIV